MFTPYLNFRQKIACIVVPESCNSSLVPDEHVCGTGMKSMKPEFMNGFGPVHRLSVRSSSKAYKKKDLIVRELCNRGAKHALAGMRSKRRASFGLPMQWSRGKALDWLFLRFLRLRLVARVQCGASGLCVRVPVRDFRDIVVMSCASCEWTDGRPSVCCCRLALFSRTFPGKPTRTFMDRGDLENGRGRATGRTGSDTHNLSLALPVWNYAST